MRASYRLVTLAVLLTALLAGGAAAAASPRSHADGLFLRLSLGAGGAATEAGLPDFDTKFSGPSVDINFAVGAIVAPNLALHGTLFGWAISDADVEINGVEGATSLDVSLGAIGGGFTYYFVPSNFYVSSSLGVGGITIENGGKAESDRGLVLDFTIGKEWWVGNNWGLGAAFGVGYHSVPDGSENIDENWSGLSFAVRFSATMN